MAFNLSKVKGAPVGRKIQFIEPAQQPSDSGKVSAEGEFIFVPVTIEDIVNPIARHHDTVYGVYHEVEEPLKADGQQVREQHRIGNYNKVPWISYNGQKWVPASELERALERERRAGAIRTLKGRLPEEFIKPEFKAIVAALGGEARKYAQVISKYLMTYFRR
jgi:hypothetical protein